MPDPTAETSVRNQPVSLPPRGFEIDELQSKLEAAASKLGDDADPRDVEQALKQAVSDALPEGQPALEYEPRAMDGFSHVAVQDADGTLRSTHVYVPEDATAATRRKIESAGPDGDRVLTEKGGTRSAKDALAENITGTDA